MSTLSMNMRRTAPGNAAAVFSLTNTTPTLTNSEPLCCCHDASCKGDRAMIPLLSILPPFVTVSALISAPTADGSERSPS